MIFEQHYLACLSQASYLIGDEATRTAVIVDPRRDVELYLERAAELGLTIRHVFLTHFHADFVSGHLELVERTGCTLHLGAKAQADYSFESARQGDVLELGRVRIEVLETPGHTPESISLAVSDLDDGSPAPQKLLTGDALFIGDVGRPDLLVSVGFTAEDLAGQLYDSLRTRVLTLPDSTVVYPAHGAGSACGKNLSKDTFDTLGAQKRTNWALRPMAREDFVRELVSGNVRPPSYFAWDADYNRRVRPTLDDVLVDGRRELSLDEALERQAAGAVVLDVRVPDVYAGGHLAASVNVGLNGRFASWVGTVVPRETEIVVVAESGTEDEAITRLARIGYDRIAGCLRDGAAAWASRPDLVRRHRRIGVDQLAFELASDSAPAVVDVRAPGEYEGGHLEGALLVPLDSLEEQLERIPRDRPFVVHCQGGYRSSIAASLLERHGIEVAGDLIGGYGAWTAAG
ncbi:MAG TPA: rhodanese-like domain-containing protein, partial [Planctomycetota bacterium]|nr:rhodanese-like domain-containing protein [Planctomycetota bacterium]